MKPAIGKYSMNFNRFVLVVAVVIGLTLVSLKGLKAWNSRVTPEKIAAGKLLFEHKWTVDDDMCGNGDGLGPVFNANSCVACHFQAGIGGSSGNDFNVTAFDVVSQDSDSPPRSGVVHSNAVNVSLRESKRNVNQMFPVEKRQVTILDGGGMYGPDCESEPLSERTVVESHDPVVFHQLNSPALFGVGLIDKMSNVAISFHGHKRLARKIAEEMSGDFNGNRLGMINMVDGSVGKFGWKGQFSSLEDFVASACAMEIGLTNTIHSQPVPKEHRTDERANLDMSRKQLDELVCFVRSLPRPQQVMPAEPVLRKQVQQGEQVFTRIGCSDCHVRDFAGIPQIYSDFHLYNLEPVQAVAFSGGYTDGKAEEEFAFDGSHPHPDQWQTPALWGVADSAPYFHDGGSPTLRRAVERHKGQAVSSLHRFQSLSTDDQQCLIQFLKSLKAPDRETPGGYSELRESQR